MVHTPSVSSTAMSIVARLPGPTSPDSFISKIRTAIAQNAEPLERARAQRVEQQATRNLREEQNSAYERSLAQDRARAQKKREEEEQRKRQEEEEKRKAAEEQVHAANLLEWRKWRAQNLQSEPSSDIKDAVRINIRLPSGERVMRRFAPGLPLEEVYAFVECYDIISSDGSEDSGPVYKPDGFDFDYGFLLVSPMPREEHKLADGGTVRERIGRSGNLIVETLDEEESDDDDEEEEYDEKDMAA